MNFANFSNYSDILMIYKNVILAANNEVSALFLCPMRVSNV